MDKTINATRKHKLNTELHTYGKSLNQTKEIILQIMNKISIHESFLPK
jgi:hypothetical protein